MHRGPVPVSYHGDEIRRNLAALESQEHQSEPEWMSTARGELGVKEIRGGRDNPRILEYHATTGLSADDDETPWCASFIGWCLEQHGIAGTGSARARSYETYGAPLMLPRVGCIVVMWRGRPSGRSGHVTFYDGPAGPDHMAGLGGNQKNRVGVDRYSSTDRVIGYRWPLVTG